MAIAGRRSDKKLHPFMIKIMEMIGCGTNREAAAKKLNIPRSTFDNYALGKFVPSLPHAQKIAKETGLTLDEIFAGFTGETAVAV